MSSKQGATMGDITETNLLGMIKEVTNNNYNANNNTVNLIGLASFSLYTVEAGSLHAPQLNRSQYFTVSDIQSQQMFPVLAELVKICLFYVCVSTSSLRNLKRLFASSTKSANSKASSFQSLKIVLSET